MKRSSGKFWAWPMWWWSSGFSGRISFGSTCKPANLDRMRWVCVWRRSIETSWGMNTFWLVWANQFLPTQCLSSPWREKSKDECTSKPGWLTDCVEYESVVEMTLRPNNKRTVDESLVPKWLMGTGWRGGQDLIALRAKTQRELEWGLWAMALGFIYYYRLCYMRLAHVL